LAQVTPPTSREASSNAVVGDIIVTAQKRSERAMNVPLSITAATGDTLTKLGVTSVADLAKIVPGFSFTQSGYGAPVYTLRGVGFYDEAVAVAPAVSVYVDQIPLPYPRMAEGVALDVQRVEVLKGPQGTLFGLNATGGAVNYIANKPGDRLETGGDLTFGRFATAQAQAYLSGPISDTLGARVATRYEMSGDWQKSTTSDRTNGQRDFLTGRVLLDWKPSDALIFELNLNGWRDKSDTQAPQYRKYSATNPPPQDGGTGYTGSPGYQPTLDADLRSYPVVDGDRAADWTPGYGLRRNDWFYQAALRADWKLSDSLTLTSLTAFSKLGVDSPAEADGTRFVDLQVTVKAHVKSFTQELRLSGASGANDELKYMIGGNYERDSSQDSQHILQDGTNAGFATARWAASGPVNFSNQRFRSKAVFGSLDYNILPSLTLQASGRFTKNHRSMVGCVRDNGDGVMGRAFGLLSNTLRGVAGEPVPGDPGYVAPGTCLTTDPDTHLPIAIVTNGFSEHNFSWRTGFSWKPIRDMMLYANVARGFKAGSYGTIPILLPVQAQPIPQERLTAYEAGFKSSFLNRAVDVTGAVFYYNYRNKQLLSYLHAPPFGDIPGEVNIPKSRVKGAEFNMTVRPVRGLQLYGAATYLDSRITGSFRNPSPDALYTAAYTAGHGGLLPDFKGERFTDTPKWSLQGDAQYTFPISSGWKSYVGANISYRTSTNSVFGAPVDPTLPHYTTADDYKIPAYALIDLRLGFESDDGKYRVQFWGRNVTNKYYWLHITRIQDTLSRQTGMPATYGVTVSGRF
jgi:outer membrane receptor protein involved in Fe transport